MTKAHDKMVSEQIDSEEVQPSAVSAVRTRGKIAATEQHQTQQLSETVREVDQRLTNFMTEMRSVACGRRS